MLDTLEISDFEPYLNQTIHLSFGDLVRFPTVLVQVRKVVNHSPLVRDPFAIVVRSEQKTQYYEQTTFTLEHPDKGNLDVFFVPVGFDGEGVLYEAVFS
jgi:hypothetical protein